MCLRFRLASTLIGSSLPIPANVSATTPVVEIPDGATECCNGDIIVQPEDLGRYHRPPQDTPAHAKVMGTRNSSESPFGALERRGGFDSKSCQAFGLVPRSLAAVLAAAAHNIQLTMNRELNSPLPVRKKPRAKQPKICNKTHTEPATCSEPAAAGPHPPAGPQDAHTPANSPDSDPRTAASTSNSPDSDLRTAASTSNSPDSDPRPVFSTQTPPRAPP